VTTAAFVGITSTVPRKIWTVFGPYKVLFLFVVFPCFRCFTVLNWRRESIWRVKRTSVYTPAVNKGPKITLKLLGGPSRQRPTYTVCEPVKQLHACTLCVVLQIFDFSLSDDDVNEILTKCDCSFRALTDRQYVTSATHIYIMSAQNTQWPCTNRSFAVIKMMNINTVVTPEPHKSVPWFRQIKDEDSDLIAGHVTRLHVTKAVRLKTS